jgi:hypothetical protein
MVQLPDGKQWFFRYYDPRVLKTYLLVCELWELQKLFGPIRAFAVSEGAAGKLMMLQATPHGLSEPPRLARQPRLFWTIRPEQHAEFKRAAEASFVDRTIGFLREKLPDQTATLSPELLRQRVEIGIARARGYGITWQSSMLTFVTLMFEIAPNFDEHPRILGVLTDDHIAPDFRPKELLNRISGRVWGEARQLRHPSAWATKARAPRRG